MAEDVFRPTSLSIIVILAGNDVSVVSLVPALRSHCTLVCTSAFQAVEAAPYFEPDVVLIDIRLPDPMAIVRELSQATGGRPLVFATLRPAAGPVPTHPCGFRYWLGLPAAAGELEQVLWKIRADRSPSGPDTVDPPDVSKIG
jgi:hypothetical protein